MTFFFQRLCIYCLDNKNLIFTKGTYYNILMCGYIRVRSIFTSYNILRLVQPMTVRGKNIFYFGIGSISLHVKICNFCYDHDVRNATHSEVLCVCYL